MNRTSNKPLNVAILGLGEVGQAMQKLASKKHTIYGIDRNRDETDGVSINILHICIPYTQSFVKIVVEYIRKIKPELVIVESTVAVGTTRAIWEKTTIPTVHSPIRGIHPNLEKNIKIFIKYIGPVSKADGEKAARYYKQLGIQTDILQSPEESELGKLLSTTYYAWNIVYCKEVKKICNFYRTNFDNVYTKFNKTYNRGYIMLNKPEVIRPVLKPVKGGFGGHCLYENAVILNKQLPKRLRTVIAPVLRIGKKK